MGEKLGMIGLGKMGLALARQMRNDGHELFGYDTDPERMKLFEGEGGTPVASAKILAENATSRLVFCLNQNTLKKTPRVLTVLFRRAKKASFMSK
ncbi:MAG: NAD(P)-binding domain-containing protein [Rhodospirillales bacterium]